MNRTLWDASNDPLPMLDWLIQRGSDRKFRLFTCACMRRLAAFYGDYDLALIPAIEAEEARADGRTVTYKPPYRGLWTAAGGGRSAARTVLESFEQSGPPWETARRAAWWAYEVLQRQTNPDGLDFVWADPDEARAQAALLRDLFGHLFHPDHLWVGRLGHTDEVERLACAIYADHSFSELPILADALEDAGCADVAILEHCREPAEHVRGCWVVDALLGRS